MKILTNLVNYKNPNSLANKFRQKRFRFFEEKLKLVRNNGKELNAQTSRALGIGVGVNNPVKILDIGGTQLFWENCNYHNKNEVRIIILNLFKEKVKYPNFKSIAGDACDLSSFNDNEFDVVFSNSVIEHLFKKGNQFKMASEVMRVGKYHFIQTPNLYFPIEPHFLFPLFQFLPLKIKIFLLTKTTLIRGIKRDKEAAEKKVNEIRLLSKKQLKELFPHSLIYEEKFWGMTKSFIAHNFIL